MYNKLPGKFLPLLFKGLPLALVIVGSILLLIFHYFFSGYSMPIEAGTFSEMVKIPLDIIDLEIYRYELETQNYLLFQHFESLSPLYFPHLTMAFGIAVWFLMGISLSLVSMFKRMQFILSMVLIIFLLTLTGVNNLHIGGVNTNLPMILLMAGLVLPAVLIHTFCDHWDINKRTVVILATSLLTLPILVYFGEAPSGELLVFENISILGLAIAAIFMLYTGHAVISSAFVFLARLNRGVGIKISWHISILSLIYLAFCFFLLLNITGNLDLNIPLPPIMILFLLVGVMGYFETKRKMQQIDQPYQFTAIGEGLYLIGFAVTLLVFWKGEFSANQPMTDFLNHVFIYSQFAFSLLFYAYLMINFSEVMDKGNQVEKVIFKPKFFGYYHMRIGAMLGMLSVVVFADGIIGVQFSTASTNVSAAYYQAINRPREAAILYENSWERYRRNEKAMNAVAHLALAQNQPTSALNSLLRSYENRPSVNDVLLLSTLLQKGERKAEALEVLQKGLEYFPGNPYLMNNIALLYSGNNRGEAAFNLLDEIQGINDVVIANKIGLQAKHLIHYDDSLDYNSSTTAKVNQLAFENLKRDTAVFSIPTTGISDAGALFSRAILRNQWSNSSRRDIAEDFALIDTLLAHNFVPAIEEDLRETRVIRGYQQDYVNESLKYINGLAYEFTNSAGFYHSMAANILIGELDFEKAAIELVQAEEKGFRNFESQHLPVLYFGGEQAGALEISVSHGIPFPEWMKFRQDGQLISNDTTIFFSHLSTLHQGVKSDFITGLDKISHPGFKRFFAYQVLLRKGHWLDQEEIKRMIALIEDNPHKGRHYEFFAELKDFYLERKIPGSGRLLDEGLSLERNPYWTPLIFEALKRSKDNLEKYNMLLEASSFNKDPLLWINLVKYSRIIGVDSYASSTLRKMNEWVDTKTLEELQLQNL